MIRRVEVRGSFLEVPKFQAEEAVQHPGSCSVSPQPCSSLRRVRAGAVLGGDKAAGALPGWASVTYLSFSYQQKDIS